MKKKQIQFPKHDLELEDMSKFDLQQIKSAGIRLIVDTPIEGQVEAIVQSFMSHLHAKGYKIVKIGDSNE